MPISSGKSIAIIIVMAIFTLATRALPFIVFGGKKEVPSLVKYLGLSLPPAVIVVLIVYSLKDIALFTYPSILSQGIAIIAVTLLHLWKKNNLLSIGGGTLIYMILVQLVFV